MPAFNPCNTKRDGTVFIGLSLSRKSTIGHKDTITHQTAFDFNKVLDRNYQYVQSCDDSGWHVGGGEPGSPVSFKIPAKDTAHIELMRIGTFRPEWGGVSEEDIIRAMYSGKILIPQIEVLPTSVTFNGNSPPDLQIRFDMEPSVPDFDDPNAPLPINWSLRFVQNQLFRYFRFPGRFCPDPFHMTILKRAEFRSNEHQTYYLAKCYNTIKEWHRRGPQPLNNGGWDIDGSPLAGFVGMPASEFNSGLWLFQDRHTISHFFPPNFLPPYDTPEKRSIILDCLRHEWDDKTLRWRPAGYKLYREMNPSEVQIEEERNSKYICAPVPVACCGAFDSCIQS